MILVAALLGPSTRAEAQRARRVGVVVTLGVNVEPPEQRALSQALGNAIGEALPVDVIAGEDAERRLPAAGLPEECVAEPACRSELGARLDADELLLLVLVRIGDRTQIDATWADVHSGDVTSRPRMELEPDTDRGAYFAAMAPRLLPHIEVPKAADPVRPEIVVLGGGDDRWQPGRRMTTGAWIAAGVAAAGVVGGTVFTVSAKRKYDDLADAGCRDVATPACRKSDIDSLDRHTLAADLLYGAAIAAGVTSAVLYLRSAPDEPQEEPELGVTPIDGGAAITFGGRF